MKQLLIQTEAYGSEGIRPIPGAGCPKLMRPNSGGGACISSSGGSICGGYMGEVTVEGLCYTKCDETYPEIFTGRPYLLGS